VGELIARLLYNEGFYSVEEVAEVEPEELAKILVVPLEKAKEIVRGAQKLVGKEVVEEEEELDEKAERIRRGDQMVDKLPGLNPQWAQWLKDEGIESIRDLFQADKGQLMRILKISAQEAEELIRKAKQYIDTGYVS